MKVKYMYNVIKTKEDIDKLMQEYSGFHDSCIVSVSYHSGAKVDKCGAMSNGGVSEHTAEIILHSQWKNPIKLKFTGVRKCSIVGWQDNYFCDIFGAYIGFHTELLGDARDDRLIVWADYDCFDPAEYHEEEIISQSGNNCTYIIAEGLSWEIIEE